MRFLVSTPALVAIGLAVLAYLLVALRLEIRARRAGWRRGVLVVVAVCLFMLAARPARERPVAAGRAVLVTAGAAEQQVTPLALAAEVLTLPGASVEVGAPLVDLAGLLRRRPDLQQWQIIGRGLEPWEAELLPGEVTFAAPVAPRPGIDRAQWRRRIAVGQRLEVRGSVTGVQGPATVRLDGPAGVEDTQELAAAGAFTLRATPRQEGRFLYRLELSSAAPGAADGPLASAEIAVEVAPRRPPRILWLEGAPGFESRELKGWLRDVGGALVVRSQVSRGRFRFEALNHPPLLGDRLSSELLAGFDLVVLDGPAWGDLAARERTAVEAAVADGLGLLLVPALPGLGGDGQPPFALEPVGDLESLEVTLGAAGATLAPLVIPARQFVVRTGQRPLLADTAERTLAVAEPRGAGLIAATLVEGTYRWVLRGESASHRHYWSDLLGALARPREGGLVNAPVGPLLVDRPVALEQWAAAPAPLRVVAPDGTALALPLVQDPHEPRRWQANWWPRTSGWHALEQGDATVWWHVEGASGWPAWQDRQRQEATERRAALGPEQGSAAAAAARLHEVARWPWFALLLALWAALWADEHWRRRPSGG